MAKETVDAVRQAELNATKIENESAVKKEEIIQKASDDAKLLISTRTKEELAKSARELDKTNVASENLMKEAVLKAEQEISLLRELVKSKEKAAIELVLGEVI